jgi:hypothetical protein
MARSQRRPSAPHDDSGEFHARRVGNAGGELETIEDLESIEWDPAKFSRLKAPHPSRSGAVAEGGRGDAAAVWRELKDTNPRYSPATHIARIPFRNPADADRLIDGLRKAGLAEE